MKNKTVSYFGITGLFGVIAGLIQAAITVPGPGLGEIVHAYVFPFTLILGGIGFILYGICQAIIDLVNK